MYCVGMKTKGIISSPQRQCSSARSKPCRMQRVRDASKEEIMTESQPGLTDFQNAGFDQQLAMMPSLMGIMSDKQSKPAKQEPETREGEELGYVVGVKQSPKLVLWSAILRAMLGAANWSPGNPLLLDLVNISLFLRILNDFCKPHGRSGCVHCLCLESILDQ